MENTTKQTIEGQILSIDLFKEGEKDGRKWQMFKVDISGQQFITFDWQYKQKINQNGIWEYEEKTTEKNGKQYVNKTLVNLPRPKPEWATKSDIKALDERIKALEDFAFNPNHQNQNEVELSEINIDKENITADDLPF
jgi:hypothetical protein